ncbi:MAG: FtsX-like permease family protein [Opitutales bacterium]|nr:FtsX-like permease family protein [Opitutales bacterium]
MNGPSGALPFLLARTTLRHWRRSPWQTTAYIAILALGVAAFLSIRIANREATASFSGFTVAATGGTDWTLRPMAGRFDESVLFEVRGLLDEIDVHILPVLEATVTPVRGTDTGVRGQEYPLSSGPRRSTDDILPVRALRILGLDLLGLGNLFPDDRGRRVLSAAADAVGVDDIWELLRDPRAVYVSPALARQAELGVGDALPVLIDDHRVTLRVRGVLPVLPGSGPPPPGLAVMDIAALQALLGAERRVGRIEFIVPDGPMRETGLAALRARLTGGEGTRWLSQPPEDEAETAARMTAAFRLNLAVLGLIALLVGLYLIAQGMDAAVVRRRHEIAILRSLGLTEGGVARLWLGELLLLGLLAGSFGSFLGYALAHAAVGAMGETVSALYRVSDPGRPRFSGTDLALGMALGLGGSLIGGWLPVRDAARTPPAQVLARGNFSPGFGFFRRHGLGWGAVALGAVLAFLPPVTLDGGARFPLAGYTAAFLWLIGGTILAAGLLAPGARALSPLPVGSAPWAVALSRLRRPGSRHRLAVAGLYIAVGMAAAMNILVGSFEHTMERWIETRFRADVYVSPLGRAGADAGGVLREDTWRAIAAMPEVKAHDPFRTERIRLDGIDTFLSGSDFALLGTRQRLLWIAGPLPEERIPTGADAPAIASESFVRRFGAAVGDTVTVPTPSGPRRLFIQGVQADFGNERGSLLIDFERFAEWWGDSGLTNLTLFLREGTDAGAFARRIEETYPVLNARDNASLRAAILTVFRQTFATTHALRIIAVVVALAGLVLALATLLREDARGLATLRALGFTRREIARCTLFEGLGITLAGLLGGLLLSGALGALLVYVINRQSFGWTLLFRIPAGDLFQLALALTATAALAAYLTGLRAAGGR